MDFLKKFKETILAILPILIIVIALNFLLISLPDTVGLSDEAMTNFLIASALVVFGQVIFLVGVENSIVTMGEMVGASVVKFKKVFLILGFGFIFGFLCTMAEPDVQVLGSFVSKTAPTINGTLLIVVVALGVAVYTALALVKTLFKIKLKYMLFLSYIIVFALASFTPGRFIALSFDSGGVTTGPITVPFILALCIGVAAVRGENNSEDSFGMVSLASVGPIIAILILGLLNGGSASEVTAIAYPPQEFFVVLGETAKEVATAILPMTIIFLIFQTLFIRLPRLKLIKIILGVVIVFIGLALFLTGVNFGFSAAGHEIGQLVAGTDYAWILIPVGGVIGVATVFTEPAINVLGGQVEKVTSGHIKKRMLSLSLAVGIGTAVMLSVIKVMFAVSLWWFIIPGYAAAIGLMFFSPEIFTAIAFDSGGVASGPMTATFTLPLIIGISEQMPNSSILSHAFGLVAIVAMMPPIVIQVMGIVYKMKEAKHKKAADLRNIEDTKESETFVFEAFRLSIADDVDFSGLAAAA
jgi:hypothetical protein